MTREAMEGVLEELTRRRFLKKSIQAAGIAVFWDRFGDRLFGQNAPGTTDPNAVLSAIGNLVVPVDQDPGYATFDPGITQYTMNVMIAQVLLGGNPLVFPGIQGLFVSINELPPMINFSTFQFLQMPLSLQNEYLANILTGQFEANGAQDVLFLGAFVGLFATRGVFFSNYPHHLATPGADIQTVSTSGPKTGWQIMGYRGPVQADEETALRTKYFNAATLPGVDPSNPYF